MLAVFAYTSAKAYTVSGGVLTINGSGDMPGSRPAGDFTTIKLVGDFTAGWGGGWAINDGANTKGGITKIDMSQATFKLNSGTVTSSATNTVANVSVSPSWNFKNFPDLKDIVWPAAGNIDGIPSNAFDQCGLEEVHIPGYIKWIADHAFNETSDYKSLKKIFFDKWEGNDANVHMYLGLQAFSNTYGVTDVYIETEGILEAANNAFPHMDTYGHADITRTTARLHFPASKADLYVNQNHTLDQATAENDKLFQEWLVEHYSAAGAAGNGFYEFVSNASTGMPGMSDVVLRTFSSATIDYVVPKGAKAYIVNGITTSGSGDNKLFYVQLKRVNVIPHGTGVIIFGGANTDDGHGNKILGMMAVKYSGPGAYTRDNTSYSSDYRNKLVATANASESNVQVEPYEVEGGKVKWRNFGLGNFGATVSGAKYYKEHHNYGTGAGLPNGNFIGFFRLKSSEISSGKAYLRLTADEYDKENGGEVIVAKQNDYDQEYADGSNGDRFYTQTEMCNLGIWYLTKGDSNSHIEWEASWGTRSLASDFTMANFIGEPMDDDVTMILPASMVEVQDNAKVYNLQGMEVANPTKGVYIKNGKKFVVK